jgi:uncharacterized protein YndB with AHSA1/START domain
MSTPVQTGTRTSVPDVRKSVTVPVSAEQAFAVFVDDPMQWWPETHILVRERRTAIVFDRAVGGRFYERAVDGSEATWGRMLHWDPPRRIAMTWRIDGRWQSIDNDDAASEIEVTFTALGANSTRVELAHVNLHRHGADAVAIHRALDGPSPGETLESYARAVARSAG